MLITDIDYKTSVKNSMDNFKFIEVKIRILMTTVHREIFQKFFIFNLAVSDCLIAIVGLFRGLGIIDPVFIGFVNGEENGWCSAYLLFMMFVR